MNTAMMCASFNSYLQGLNNRSGVHTETLNLYHEIVRKAHAQVEAVAADERTTQADRSKSEEGKFVTIATRATKAASAFAFLERVVSRIEGERNTAKANLDTIKAPATLGDDPLLRYLFAKEIRDRYTGLNQQERDMAYLQAAAEDHDSILWAFQETPGGPMITPDSATRLRRTGTAGTARPLQRMAAKRLAPRFVERVAQRTRGMAAWLRGKPEDDLRSDGWPGA